MYTVLPNWQSGCCASFEVQNSRILFPRWVYRFVIIIITLTQRCLHSRSQSSIFYQEGYYSLNSTQETDTRANILLRILNSWNLKQAIVVILQYLWKFAINISLHWYFSYNNYWRNVIKIHKISIINQFSSHNSSGIEPQRDKNFTMIGEFPKNSVENRDKTETGRATRRVIQILLPRCVMQLLEATFTICPRQSSTRLELHSLPAQRGAAHAATLR